MNRLSKQAILRLSVWVVFAAAVFMLDRVTKSLALAHLSSVETKSLLPFLNLQLAYNFGSSFSLLTGEASWQRYFLLVFGVVASLALIVWLSRLSAKHTWDAFGLSLVLGGALSNLWDRWVLGYVIDFIDLHLGHWHWPAFNLADSAICIGVIILIIQVYQGPATKKTKH